jgi:hypothetical protein
MWSIFAWLGTIASAISLFRLAWLWFGFGLSRPAALLLDFYVQFFHPLVEVMKPLAVWLVSLFGFVALPKYWQDVAILYVMVMLAMVRFLRANYFHQTAFRPVGDDDSMLVFPEGVAGIRFERPRLIPRVVWFALDALLALAWPVFPLLYAIVALTAGPEVRERLVETILGWGREIAKVAAAVLLFVATNAAATSLP